jgi:hypothetical protein
MIKVFIASAAIFVMVVGFAAPAQADILGPYSSSISSALTDWSGNMVFPQFDSSLGTLMSVELYVGSSFDTVLTVSNTGDSSSSGWAKTEVQVFVLDSGNYLGIDAPQLDLYSPQYNFSLGANQSITSGQINKSGTFNQTYTDSNILTEFTGAGNITLNASTVTNTVISYTGGNTNATQVTHASATGKITYNYEPVPEPTTLVLLASGLLCLVFCLRRKR